MRMNKKTIVRLIASVLLSVVFFVAMPQPVAMAAKSKNLLKNPGAETGTLSGWTDASSNKCWRIAFKGTIEGWEHPAARTGTYYFLTGWPKDYGTKNYLYQDVKIGNYVGKKLTFGAWLSGCGHTDKGGLKLAFYNKSGKLIGSKSSKLQHEEVKGRWVKHLTVSMTVPSNAYKVRAYLIGILNEGAECDAYFDDLTLIASSKAAVPAAGVVSSISNVNGSKAKVTIKKVTNAKKYQIRYKVGSAKSWKTLSSTANSFKIPLKKNKTTVFQVRAKNSSGWGSWGRTVNLKVK